jgi:hypothetical protein
MRALRANTEAIPTANALVGLKRQHGPGIDSFGVVTPDTPQGTALNEYGCADSGTIMDRETLYLENTTGDRTAAKVRHG